MLISYHVSPFKVKIWGTLSYPAQAIVLLSKNCMAKNGRYRFFPLGSIDEMANSLLIS